MEPPCQSVLRQASHRASLIPAMSRRRILDVWIKRPVTRNSSRGRALTCLAFPGAIRNPESDSYQGQGQRFDFEDHDMTSYSARCQTHGERQPQCDLWSPRVAHPKRKRVVAVSVAAPPCPSVESSSAPSHSSNRRVQDRRLEEHPPCWLTLELLSTAVPACIFGERPLAGFTCQVGQKCSQAWRRLIDQTPDDAVEQVAARDCHALGAGSVHRSFRHDGAAEHDRCPGRIETRDPRSLFQGHRC